MVKIMIRLDESFYKDVEKVRIEKSNLFRGYSNVFVELLNGVVYSVSINSIPIRKKIMDDDLEVAYLWRIENSKAINLYVNLQFFLKKYITMTNLINILPNYVEEKDLNEMMKIALKARRDCLLVEVL